MVDPANEANPPESGYDKVDTRHQTDNSEYAACRAPNRFVQIGSLVVTSLGRELEDRLTALGLSQSHARLYGFRRDFSANKMSELASLLNGRDSIKTYDGLTIYATGSYARGEASLYSDVDLFFIRMESHVPIDDSRLREIKVMSDVIKATERGLELPPPSNDGEFLKILTLEEILKHLGGRDDDYRNHFTARMLLLLESAPITGADTYDSVIDAVIDSYLRDYEDHAEDFRPTFIVNDIMRFWKTLCLNYEHKRNQQENARKIKQKIRNFKLGYSRLMTCFATVGLLSSYKQITKDDLVNICKSAPLDRLLMLADREPLIKSQLVSALIQYHWFLEKTQKSTNELEAYFSCKNNRKEAFTHASKFGDEMFKIVQLSATHSNTLRYLVV
ncbi:nucleotidyltransferase domain-containing protein [Methylorubrum extorquens]|uniref:nucleotidyltransferase domain-containing protein n=1 Tax=Methylorubrum extorquens TaxID=408 RepID=UPI000158F78A|nr:nucleotidyltransferase domain-containing protein [Methylorubrum extorquens]ABY33251.1 DNA polymerase beta domain protein region [Methylorubrum extorquens PA1]WIU39823.1 nucleotidyltransferase domain-containing protein [Methylorubrum extorquens]